jgi:type I restriction-modification system DNA methylase subunit
MTIADINKILSQLAENPTRENVLNFSFALLHWMKIEPNTGNKPQLLSPQTQKLKDFLATAPQTVQPQLYRISADNQNIRVRFSVLKKLKKEYISQLVDNDPGLSSYQSLVKGLTPQSNGTSFIPSQPYFIHFVTTPDYNKLVLIFNQGEQKRIVTFRNRLTNTQYNKIFLAWQGIGTKSKPEIADLLWKSLDIKEVNKEFYKQVKERFDALLGIVKTQHASTSLSTGVTATDNQVKQFTVRLIGRYIFCWFLKEKGIIPHSLISKEIITSTDNYYQNVLLKLFFDTLNTKVQDRDPLKHNKLFEKIPYLNGGLFDESEEDKLFTKLQLDAWLLPFVEILESYDFTVDESSSQYQQVAVDPEMLGRIFENLLASQNEETEKLANQRKAFGAFYTPREIVDYMVNESIKAYLQTQWEEKLRITNSELRIEDKTKIEKTLELLFAANADASHLKKEEKNFTLQKLEQIKILDPACGSGAFPMGILHKLVELHEALGTVKSSYELKKDILSQNIYGVDIMPMAIEIARLRAWLSLVLEEDYKPNDPKHNFGVKPLPNLDFKFVCANSLIDLGLDAFIQESKGTLHEGFTEKLVNELKDLEALRAQFFSPILASSEKEKLKTDYFVQRDKVVTNIEEAHDPVLKQIARKLKEWNPFDDSKPSPFFSPTWMFGIDKGFDVVIGNPPYKILTKNNTDEKLLAAYTNNFNSIKKGNSKNIFTLMIELGANVLNKVGCLTFIVPEGLFETRSYDECKQYLYANGNVSLIVSFGHFVFENAVTGNIIFQFNKQFEGIQRRYFFTPNFSLQTIEEKKDIVIEKVKTQKTKLLSDVANLFKGMAVRGRETSVGENKKFGNDIFLLGKSISNYEINRHFYTKYSDLIIDGGTKKLSQYQIVPRILVRRTGNSLCSSYLDFFALTESTLYSVWSVNPKFSNFYLLALLNSKLLTYYVQKSMLTNKQAFPQILMTDLELLPIKVSEDKTQYQIEKLVDEILKKKKANQDTTSLEKEIDVLVYKLYELSYDEVKIIDKDFWLSEAEYEKIKVN